MAVMQTLLNVNTLELVGKRPLLEIETILSNPGYKKELLWRAPDGDWWVHIQRCSDVEQHYEIMVRDSHDDMLLYLLFTSLKQVEQQTPFHLCDFRIADAWMNDREWVI